MTTLTNAPADCTSLHSAFGPGCPYCTGPVSPCCGKPMYGGPVIFTCTGCAHDVHGSTVNREFEVLNMDPKRVTTCPVCGRMTSGIPCNHGSAS